MFDMYLVGGIDALIAAVDEALSPPAGLCSTIEGLIIQRIIFYENPDRFIEILDEALSHEAA